MKTIWKQVTTPNGLGYILYNTETNHAVITENCPKKIRIYLEANLKSKFNCYKTDEISEKLQKDRIVTNFYINDIIFKTLILNSLNNIIKIEIDGVEIDPIKEYLFDKAGNHIIKYELLDMTNIGNDAFSSCTSLTSITIPDSVTRIGERAFSYCSGLTSIDIPNSVTSIEYLLFYNCTGLTSVTIPDSVTNIGYGVFYGCNKLTSVTVPNSVTNIGSSAFQNCSGLTSIVIEATTPPALGGGAFDNTNDCPIYVPSESVEAYKAANVWSTYASRIQPI